MPVNGGNIRCACSYARGQWARARRYKVAGKAMTLIALVAACSRASHVATTVSGPHQYQRSRDRQHRIR